MEVGSKTAVVVKSEFTMGKSKANNRRYSTYLDYMDRDEAKSEQDFASYNHYMDNDQKASSLFNAYHDDLTDERKEQVMDDFKQAQNKGSILYKDVISFDNEWLQENGIYDPTTKQVDEKKLKEVTRAAVSDMHEKNNFKDTMTWTGAVHHNTENIHIHLASVDTEPGDDQRGRRKLKSLEGMRSTFVNKIQDRSFEHKEINDLMRNKIVNKKKEQPDMKGMDRGMKKDFLAIKKQLPENKRYWQYGYQNINHVKPDLDKLTEKYLQKNFPKEMKQLDQKLNKEEKMLKKVYGEGNESRYKDYKQNKKDDLYKRMGNTFLQEMKSYDYKEKNIEQKQRSSGTNQKRVNFQKNRALNQIQYGLNRVVHAELNSYQNQNAYEQMQRNIQNNQRGQSL
ncbi:MobP2 family relaxase [uncultured Marinococcus sp.]|uniref:MobP2 family relaxase n=1 Tax=uncultured Marinococcus sp. TaxID=487012 RepID=UPI00262A6096|nr:MobP2 family relaxase [uncultured Marinococcus sp.]